MEDDPYGDLRFAGDGIPSLRSLVTEVDGAENWVVHLATLSKIVAPGLRVGWSISPPEIARRCSIAKQSADVESSAWNQRIAAEYLASDCLESHVQKIAKSYGVKCQALCDSLRELLNGSITFHQPQGGMFVWARLGDGVHATDLLGESIPRKVMFVPGSGFQPANADLCTLRLSFATPTVEEIKEGVARMSKAWEALRLAA